MGLIGWYLPFFSPQRQVNYALAKRAHRRGVRNLVCTESFDGAEQVLKLEAMQLGTQDVIGAAEISSRDDLAVDDLEELNDKIEKKIRGVIHVFC